MCVCVGGGGGGGGGILVTLIHSIATPKRLGQFKLCLQNLSIAMQS